MILILIKILLDIRLRLCHRRCPCSNKLLDYFCLSVIRLWYCEIRCHRWWWYWNQLNFIWFFLNHKTNIGTNQNRTKVRILYLLLIIKTTFHLEKLFVNISIRNSLNTCFNTHSLSSKWSNRLQLWCLFNFLNNDRKQVCTQNQPKTLFNVKMDFDCYFWINVFMTSSFFPGWQCKSNCFINIIACAKRYIEIRMYM